MSAEGFTKTNVGVGGWRPKWVCNVCHREGYGTDSEPFSWSKTCRQGHAPCPYCGKQLSLRKDGTPRVHTRCSERPEEAEMLRVLIIDARQQARLGIRGPLTSKHRRLLESLRETA